jgi:prevent-host-death family protein
MKKVTIKHAKARLAQLIEQARRGDEIIICQGSRPLVKLVPVTTTKGPRKPGALEGKLHVPPEFFEPLSKQELSRWG